MFTLYCKNDIEVTRPLHHADLSEAELERELEKGLEDLAAGRVRPAEEAEISRIPSLPCQGGGGGTR